jgi:putative MFS transporter
LVARLERIPISPWHHQMRATIGAATFFDAFDNQAMTYALPALVGVWHISRQQAGFVLSATFWGQIIGALGGGWIAERRGRLFVTLLCVGVFGTMSLACAFAWNEASLMLFRFIQGIALGAEVPVASTYITEILGARGRGGFYILYEMAFALGIVGAALTGVWVVPHYGWQAMFYAGTIPLLLLFVIRHIATESPRWLINHGRLDEAEKTVEEVERKVVASGVTLPPVPPPAAGAPAWRGGFNGFEIFQGIYLKRTLVVWVMFAAVYSISNGLIIFLPTIYRTEFHVPVALALQYGLYGNVATVIMALIASQLIDRVGRKVWFGSCFIGASIALAVLWFTGANTLNEVVVLGVCSVFFAGGITGGLYMYASELYSVRARAFGTSIASSWLRLASAISPIVVGYFLSHGRLDSVCLLLSTIALTGAVVVFLFGTETNARTLEEVSP